PSGFILDLQFILDKFCNTFEFFDTYAVSCYPEKVAVPAEDVFIHFLCTEEKQKKASRVAGWISSLPRESYNLPFNWPADLQKCVCDDSLQLAIKAQVADFNTLIARFEHYSTVIDDVKFSRDTLAWAYSVWSARLFELPQYPESSSNSVNLPKWLDNDPNDLRSFAFLPIFDLLNHSSTPNVFLDIREKHVWDKTKKIHPEEKFVLSLEAKTKIAKGEELRMSYGNLSDRDLFLKYGFVLKKGENKVARVLLSPKIIHDIGIRASGAYCSYDALNVKVKERKEVIRELCVDDFYLEKAGDDTTTSLYKAALAFLLPGSTKESIILHIKERLGVNQKTKIALKHFYVFIAESSVLRKEQLDLQKKSLTRTEIKRRRESDSDMSVDSGYSYKTDASKSSFLSTSSVYSSDRPRSGRTYERPQFSPTASVTRSNRSTYRASMSRTNERGSFFNRSDSVERRTRVNAAINNYSSSPSASTFSSSARYDRSYRVPTLSSSSYTSSSSSSALMSSGRYSSRLGAVSASLNAIIATQTRYSSSTRFQNTASTSITRIRTCMFSNINRFIK
ncbi:unnamed protein product, partial [Oikopleura dioica]